jgi:hypothetical protein
MDEVSRWVEQSRKRADAGAGREAKRGVARPKSDESGRHAGHVLQIEKGNRAVKGLQRDCAGFIGAGAG